MPTTTMTVDQRYVCMYVCNYYMLPLSVCVVPSTMSRGAPDNYYCFLLTIVPGEAWSEGEHWRSDRETQAKELQG